jgi:hypothetical protein
MASDKIRKRILYQCHPYRVQCFTYQYLGLKPKATKMSSRWDLSTIIYEEPIFWMNGIDEILNLQPKGFKAKSYQIKQVSLNYS